MRTRQNEFCENHAGFFGAGAGDVERVIEYIARFCFVRVCWRRAEGKGGPEREAVMTEDAIV